MQNVLNHVSGLSFHLTGKRRKKFFQRSVPGGCYTALSYDVIHNVFVLCILHLLKAKVEVTWFDTLVSEVKRYTSRFVY